MIRRKARYSSLRRAGTSTPILLELLLHPHLQYRERVRILPPPLPTRHTWKRNTWETKDCAETIGKDEANMTKQEAEEKAMDVTSIIIWWKKFTKRHRHRGRKPWESGRGIRSLSLPLLLSLPLSCKPRVIVTHLLPHCIIPIMTITTTIINIALFASAVGTKMRIFISSKKEAITNFSQGSRALTQQRNHNCTDVSTN